MSDTQLILVILGGTFALWQIVFMAWGIRVSRPDVKVTIPLWPSILTVVLFIAAVLV